MAYYLTADGASAGIGYPAEEGWVWEEQSELVDEIREVLLIAESSQVEARFITLPVKIRNAK